MKHPAPCPHCGASPYRNPVPTVDVVIHDPACGVVIIRRANKPVGYALPGGFIDPGETMETAARRELYEETGLVPRELRYLFSLPNTYPYSGIDVFTADLFYLARVPDFSAARAADDAAALDIRPLAALHAADYGLTSIRNAVATIVDDPARLH